MTYYVRSEVLGGKTIAEVKPDATKRQGNVYANGALLAEWNNGASMVIEMNPLTGSFYKTDHNANAWREERDPRGISTGLEDPWLYVVTPTYHNLIGNQEPLLLEMGGNPFNASGGCMLDGMPTNCAFVQSGIDHGSVEGYGSDGTFFSNDVLRSFGFWGVSSFSVFVPGTGSGEVTWIGDEGEDPPDRPSIGGGGSWKTFYFGFSGSTGSVLLPSVPPPSDPHLPPRDGRTPLKDDEIQYLRDNFGKILTDACVDFINKLGRAQSGNSKFDARVDLYSAFDHVRKNKGFSWSTWNGAGKKDIVFAKPNTNSVTNLSANTVVHELIHTAMMAYNGIGSDIDLSRTLKELGIPVYLANGKLMKFDETTGKPEDRDPWYWSQGLINHCPDLKGK